MNNPTTNKEGTKHWFNENNQVHRDNDLPAVIETNGQKEWYQNGKLHRDDDKPALIYSDGSKFWCQNGELHRDGNQPAVIYASGSKRWWKNNIRHRENNQPAVIDADGTKHYFIDGKQYYRIKDGISKQVCQQCPEAQEIKTDKVFCNIFSFNDCPFILEHLVKTQIPYPSTIETA